MLFHAYGLFYPVGGEHTSLFTSLGGSAATTSDGFFSADSAEGSPFYGHVGVGVEYRKDFVFRFKVNALFFDGGYLVPWPGFTFGYAFYLYQGLPFSLRIPNKLTRKTLNESRHGKGVHSFESLGDMFKV